MSDEPWHTSTGQLTVEERPEVLPWLNSDRAFVGRGRSSTQDWTGYLSRHPFLLSFVAAWAVVSHLKRSTFEDDICRRYQSDAIGQGKAKLRQSKRRAISPADMHRATLTLSCADLRETCHKHTSLKRFWVDHTFLCFRPVKYTQARANRMTVASRSSRLSVCLAH